MMLALWFDISSNTDSLRKSRNYRDMHRDKILARYNLLEEQGLRKAGSATGNLFDARDFSQQYWQNCDL